MKRVFLSALAAVSTFAATGAKPTVTFAKDVAPILYSQCTSCHRPGQAAPFSLLTYDDAVKHARVIATVTRSRYMPPWKAEPASYAYRDVRRLTDEQIATLEQWAKQGMPKGDMAKAPEPPKYSDDWALGTPDLIVEMPEPITIPASGPDMYKNLIIPVRQDEEKWIRAIEMKPTARSVVHHVLYFADNPESAKKINQATGEGAAAGMPFTATTVPLGGWAVGGQPHLYPDGLALSLPKGYDLVIQYHFHPSGKQEIEKSQIALYFAKEAPARPLINVQLPVLFSLFSGLKIPAGQKNFSLKDSFVLPADVEAVVVGAHAHYLGKTMKMTATLPDGTVKTLLDIKDWDFAWQDRYFFDQFVPLPKGTRLDGEITWDNSADNPRNPSNPPINIAWGEQSFDEMGGIGLQFVARDQEDTPALRKAVQQHTRQVAGARLMSDVEFRKWFMERFGDMLKASGGGNPFDGSNRTAK